ncbi:torsin-4A [Boleophthalmus pectinirostris]|uniref:torsin-4A n=1 Tax=Boleophthalmus pectinirostris TaxID=150288 RepID=UPI000A1C1A65|nr:torsin-4A [Boleophthalmus pectinirostris]
MSDQDSSASASQTGDFDEDTNSELEVDRDDRHRDRHVPSLSSFSSSLSAVIRIKQKYQAMKKRRQDLALSLTAAGTQIGAPVRTSPKIFTFDALNASAYSSLDNTIHQKKKRRRKKRVLFPNSGGRRVPPKQERSRAKHCLYLLLAIVFLQVYNAIENLDDHVLKYDLEGLEKTLRREVFGQQGAVEGLMSHLQDYLSTYVHNKPLVVSVHGPSGVGKSLLGRLLAGHFRSVVGEALVLQYYVLHHCPQEADAVQCAQNLCGLISQMVQRAEEEEKIPLLIFDEVEYMHQEILDALWQLMATKQSNEYLNVIYLFLSNLGHEQITKHLLHNSSSDSVRVSGHDYLIKELTPILRNTLDILHPLWAEADILPLGLLEKVHVMDCFLEEITREGFYPDHANIERLAGEIEYYPVVGGHEYSQTGCKQVVAKVNLL